MKSVFHLLLIAGLALAYGCAENKTRVGEGAGIGGILGAAAGGIIGHQSGHGWEGALIGGAAGATGGAVVGSQMNKPQTTTTAGQPMAAQTTTTTTTTTTTGTLTMQQIVDMTKQGSTSDQIIAQIQSTHSTYVLTADDVSYLRSNGVSQRVVEYMQSTK